MKILIGSVLAFYGGLACASNWQELQNEPNKKGICMIEKIAELSGKVNILLAENKNGAQFSIGSGIAVGDTIYIGTNEGAVVAVGRATGTELWRTQTAGPIRASPAYADERVFVASMDGTIRALDPNENGANLWVFEATSPLAASPTPVQIDGVTYIYTAATNGDVYCLKAEDGELVWDAKANGRIWASPAYSSTSNRIYIGSYDGRLYAYDALSGELKWVTDPQEIKLGPIRACVAIHGNDIYIPTLRRGFVSIKDEGYSYAFRWGVELTGSHTGAAAIVPYSDDSSVSIYVANDAGEVYALRGSDGHQLWDSDLKARVAGSVAFADGKVFIPSEDGKLHALSDSDGSEEFSSSTTEAIDSSLAISKGTVYLIDAAGILYGFGNSLEPPEALSAVAHGVARIGLSWSQCYIPDGSDGSKVVSGYFIYRSHRPDRDFAKIGYVNGVVLDSEGQPTEETASVYVDSSLTAAGTYFYSVTSAEDTDEDGDFEESTYSDIAWAETIMMPEINIAKAEAGDGVIRLNWQMEGRAPGVNVQIYKKEGAETELELYKIIVGAIQEYEDVRVENGIEYTYVIVPMDDLGNPGAESDEILATPKTIDWPYYQRNVLHDGNDPDENVSPPLGERWRLDFPADTDGATFKYVQGPIIVDGRLYASSLGGEIRAHDAVTGELIWTQNVVRPNSTPAYHNGRIYVTAWGPPDGLTVLDADTGEIIWSLPIEEFGRGQESSPVVYKGVLYAGVIKGGQFCMVAVDIDPSSDTFKQVIWTSGAFEVFVKCSPAAARGKAYIVDGNGNVRAFNALTGEQLWVKKLGLYVTTTQSVSLTVSPPVLLLAHENGRLYAIDAESGILMWEKFVASRYASPALNGNIVYIASQSTNTVYARDILTGNLEWVGYTYTVTGNISHGTPVIADGRLHVYTTNGQLFTLNLADGSRLDTLNLNASVEQAAFAAGSGQLFVPTLNGQIIGITPIPGPVGNLHTDGEDSAIILNWLPATPNQYEIAGYRIYRRIISENEWTLIGYVEGAATDNFTDNTPEHGVDYSYILRAVDSRGIEGRDSNIAFGTVYLPIILADIRVQSGDGAVSLSWEIPSSPYEITEVEIHKRELAGDLQLLRRVPAVPSSFIEMQVENGIEYGYVLYAVTQEGEIGVPSEEIRVTPQSNDWPMYQRNTLHEGNDPEEDIPPPLGHHWASQFQAGPEGRAFRYTQGPVIVSGTLFATSLGGEVRAHKAIDGTLIWQQSVVEPMCTPLFHNGRIYVTHYGPPNGLTVLNADTGEIEWTLPIEVVGRGQESSPVIYKGVLYAGVILDGQFKLVAVDIDPASPTYKTVLWAAGPMSIFIKCSPGAALGRVYVVDGAGNVWAFNAKTGNVLWWQPLGQYMATTQSISIKVSPPVVMVAHEDGKLYAFNAEFGNIMWVKEVYGRYASPAIGNGKVYVASQNINTVFARDILTGNLEWLANTYTVTGSYSHGTPVIAGNRLYVYSTNSQLFTIDLNNGQVLDTYSFDSPIEQGPFAASAGHLYLTTLDGWIKSIAPVAGPPQNVVSKSTILAVSLTWDEAMPTPNGIKGYRIWRAPTPNEPGEAIAYVLKADVNRYDDPATPGVTFYYSIQADDLSGLVGRKSDPVAGLRFKEPNLIAQITSPPDGYMACPGNPVNIMGTANSGNFQRYILEVNEGSGYVKLAEGSTPVINGLLGKYTPQAGAPVIKLTTFDATGQTASAEVKLGSLDINLVGKITWPSDNQTFIGCAPWMITVLGVAYGDNFRSYEVQLSRASAPNTIIQSVISALPVYEETKGLGVLTLPDCDKFIIRLIVTDGCARKLIKEVVVIREELVIVDGGTVRTFSTRGKDPGEHRLPWDVTVDNEDYVWVVDTQNRRIQKYTAQGHLLFEFGSHATGKSEGVTFSEPVAAAVDINNDLIVLDRIDGHIYNFDENGMPIFKTGGQGKGEGKFMKPEGLAVDQNGLLYVADTLNNRIQILNRAGWPIKAFGGEGEGPGQFEHPTGVSIDPNTKNIIVTDSNNSRIQIFTSEGEFISSFGSLGVEEGQFDRPFEAVVGAGRNLFVSEIVNNRLSWFTLFDKIHRFITFVPPADYPGRFFKHPHGMALDPREETLYVADTGNNRIVAISIKTLDDSIPPKARILSPFAGQEYAGKIEVIGQAVDAYFKEYRLEFGEGDNPSDVELIAESNEPVWSGILGTWNCEGLVAGTYTIILTVVDLSGNISRDRVVIEISEPAVLVGYFTNESSGIPSQIGRAFWGLKEEW